MLSRGRGTAGEATCKELLQVRLEGTRQVERKLKSYSLPMIMAVGFRVRSPRGVQFRRWTALTSHGSRRTSYP